MAERSNERAAKVKPEESESERKGAGHLAATTARAKPADVHRTANTRPYMQVLPPADVAGVVIRFRVCGASPGFACSTSFEEEDESPFVGLLRVEAA